MFFLKESVSDPERHWGDLAASVTDGPYGKKLVLRNDIGSGYFKTVSFEDGLKLVLTDYTLHRGFSKVYNQDGSDYYYLHMNQVRASERFSVCISHQELSFNNKLYSSVFLTCSEEPFEIKTTPGTYFNQLKIAIPKSWPAAHLPDTYCPFILNEYFALEAERLYFDSIDAVYLKLVNRLVEETEQIKFLALVHGMVTIIIARFFSRMAARLGKANS